MSEPMTFQKKSRRERYIVRDDVERVMGIEDRKSRIISGFQRFKLPNIVWHLSGSIIKNRTSKTAFCSQFAPEFQNKDYFQSKTQITL